MMKRAILMWIVLAVFVAAAVDSAEYVLFPRPKEVKQLQDADKWPAVFKQPGVIVVFSMTGCAPCREVKAEFKRHLHTHNILFAKAEDPTQTPPLKVDGVTVTYRDLMDKWKLEGRFPTVCIVDNGKLGKVWVGKVPWDIAVTYADAAKKRTVPLHRLPVNIVPSKPSDLLINPAVNPTLIPSKIIIDRLKTDSTPRHNSSPSRSRFRKPGKK